VIFNHSQCIELYDNIRLKGNVGVPQASETIETTVGEVSAELARRGIEPNEPATIIIEPAKGFGPARVHVVVARRSEAPTPIGAR
jgi:hypothetical protein